MNHIDRIKFENIIINSIDSIDNISRDSTNNVSMTNFKNKIINFDRVKEMYSKKIILSEKPSSVDAMFFGSEKNFLIEFKNGEVNKNDIIKKIYDSLIIYNDIFNTNLNVIKKTISFILVYNFKKNPIPRKEMDEFDEFLSSKADKEIVRFGLECFSKYFLSIHTYTIQQFEEKFFKSNSNTKKKNKHCKNKYY